MIGATLVETKIKDPAATKDYRWDWSKWLGTDTIQTSTFDVAGPDAALVVDDDTHDATSATAWLAGGTHGSDYKVTNHVVTAGGRTDEWTLVLLVRNQ